mgnify:CR=1 FL=1
MNITLRNIPESIIEKIRTLCVLEKRSLNNEILILLEKAVMTENPSFTSSLASTVPKAGHQFTIVSARYAKR